MANPPSAPPLDIVSVAVALATAVFSPEVAALLGPYAVIFLGAMLGGAWSASRLELPGRWPTVKYLLGIVALALLVTVPAAEIASRYYTGLSFNYLLGPVAVFIGALGPDGLRRCSRIAWARIRRWPGGTSGEPPNTPPAGDAS